MIENPTSIKRVLLAGGTGTIGRATSRALLARGHHVICIVRPRGVARRLQTESMLVLDPRAGRYDTEATPSTGTETLFDHYAALLRGDEPRGTAGRPRGVEVNSTEMALPEGFEPSYQP